MLQWLRRRRDLRYMRKNCLHHDYYNARATHRGTTGIWTAESWIREEKIDASMRKLYWCIVCKKAWIP